MATIEGYTSAPSVQAGSSISFHINYFKESYVKISVKRILATKDEDEEVAIVTGMVTPTSTPSDAYMRGCGWRSGYDLEVPDYWASGLYIAELTAEDAAKTKLFFVVRSAKPGRDARILLMTTDTTAQAYNAWGGKGTYGGKDSAKDQFDVTIRARKVSFDRPVDDGAYFRETHFWRWLVATGRYQVECCSGVDIADYAFLSQYQLLLSVGHDEYWSREMRDNVERFVDEGGNVAFFSGNTCYWQVRLEDNNRSLVCYKSAAEDPLAAVDPSRATVRWWQAPVYRPNNRMMGAGGEAGGWNIPVTSAGFEVAFPQHWVFNNTAQQRDPKNNPKVGITGYEVDGADFELRNGIPLVTGRDGTPRTFVILGYANLTGVQKPCRATMGLMRSNGCVFTAASVDWFMKVTGYTYPDGAQILADENVVHLTQNVLDKLQFPMRPEWEVIGELPSGQNLTGLTAMFGDPQTHIPTEAWLYAIIDGKVHRRLALGQNLPWVADLFLQSPADITVTAMGCMSREDGYGGDKLFCCGAGNKTLWGTTADGKGWEAVATCPMSGCTGVAYGIYYLVTLAPNGLYLYINTWGTPDWQEVAGPVSDVPIKTFTVAFADVFVVTTDNRLFHHPLQAAAAWNAPDNPAQWTLLDDNTKVDYLAAVGGRLYGFEQTSRMFFMREQIPAKRLMVACCNQKTGELRHAVIREGGRGLSTAYMETLPGEWTHMLPFTLGGQAYLFAYNDDGTIAINAINVGGKGIRNIFLSSPGNWPRGLRHVETFVLKNQPHVLGYPPNGAIIVYKINPGGQGTTIVFEGNPSTWLSGWTHIKSFTWGDYPHFLAYNQGTGMMAIDLVTAEGLGTYNQNVIRWHSGWTQIEAFVSNNQPYLLGYNQTTGAIAIERVEGSSLVNVFRGNADTWHPGWSQVRVFDWFGQRYVFMYQSYDGLVSINKFGNDFRLHNCFQGYQLPVEATALFFFSA